MDEPLDMNATVLATQLDSVKGRVDGIETSITSMRTEVAASQQSLRQEFMGALQGVRTEAAQASAALMTEIKGLGSSFSQLVKPNYSVWIAFLTLLLSFVIAIGYLATRSYDIEINGLKQHLTDTDGHVDHLQAHERQDAIKAAINSDRLQRLMGGKPSDLNADLKDDDK